MRSLLTIAALAISFGAVQAQAQSTTPPTGTPPDMTGTPPDMSGMTGAGSTASAATLIGTSVTVTQYYPDLTTAGLSSTVTVSSDVEISCPNSSIALCNADTGLLPGEYIDIGSTSISGQFLATFSANTGDTFNGLSFTGLNFGTGYSITGFTLTTNISGLSSDAITFTSNSLSLNLLGLDPSVTTDGTSVGTYTINLTVSAVPEPSSMALATFGLALLATARARQLKRTAAHSSSTTGRTQA